MDYYHKYCKYKQKYLSLKGGQSNDDIEYYYHGSATQIQDDYLEPRPSKVIDNEKAVFATNTKWFALISIAKTKFSEFEYGFMNGKPYIMENEPDMFNRLLRGQRGYLYYVKRDQFQSDGRLEMPRHEFISKDKVKIMKREDIVDVYEALKKTGIPLIEFDEKAKCIEEIIKEKKNDMEEETDKMKNKPKLPGRRYGF